ncbi:MAG TPA: rhodanese-like domain-containing protein, partial [Actinomycetota bacterium]
MEASDTLVDAAWLAAHLQHPAVRIVHVGWSAAGGTAAARRAYEEGHVVGAAFLDVDRDLAGEPFVDGPGRHPLPSADRFAATMSAIGVGDDTTVVAYDDVGGSLAARVWWMLRVTGHPAALLD